MSLLMDQKLVILIGSLYLCKLQCMQSAYWLKLLSHTILEWIENSPTFGYQVLWLHPQPKKLQRLVGTW